jgi:hypothetical protein
MGRWENTGIHNTYFPETLEELFLHGDYIASPNPLAEIARCENRAWQVLRGLPDGASPKKAIVRLDKFRRPLSEARKRDDNRAALENIMALDLRNDPVRLDARNLLLAVTVFHHTLQLYERDLARIVARNTVARRARALRYASWRFRALISSAIKIKDLDKQIQTRQFERIALMGREFQAGSATSLEEKRPDIEERDRVFLTLFESSKGKSKLQRIDKARKAFAKQFQQFNQDCKDESERVKTPSRSKAYALLEARSSLPHKTSK